MSGCIFTNTPCSRMDRLSVWWLHINIPQPCLKTSGRSLNIGPCNSNSLKLIWITLALMNDWCLSDFEQSGVTSDVGWSSNAAQFILFFGGGGGGFYSSLCLIVSLRLPTRSPLSHQTRRLFSLICPCGVSVLSGGLMSNSPLGW